MSYIFKTELTESEQIEELRANICQGKHKSAKADQAKFDEMIQKDVDFGFALPINSDVLARIPHCMVQPGGIVQQLTLTPDGTRVPKKRLMHNLTCAQTVEGVSVNTRLDLLEYPPMF